MTEKGQNRAEIVYEDNSSNCPLLVVIHSISVSADWFSATGKALSSENRLLLEVPEYTTFKDGEVLSNKDGSYIFILNMHGKYLTSLYASLAAGTKLNISDNLAAHENYIECYRLATDSEKQKMIKALKKSENPKAKEYLKRFFGIKEEPKYDFKPFDKVLVRKEGNKKWNISLFAREIVDDYNGLPYKYECSNGTLWDYCIPFEGNEYLLIKLSENERKRNFAQLEEDVEIPNGGSKKMKFYAMTETGFTGEKAIQFKLEYIAAFNKMKEIIKRASLPSYQIDDPIKRAEKWIEEQKEKWENCLLKIKNWKRELKKILQK